MTVNILHLDSSILGPYSVTREISAGIVSRLTAVHPGSRVVYHDLAAHPVPPLTGLHMAARQGAPAGDAALAADLAQGDAYIAELFAADVVVIGAPMYNFGISAQLKNWIDRVVVAGKTFRYGESGMPEALLPAGKKTYLASAHGGFYANGGPLAALEHHENYLQVVLPFIGLTDITVVRAEGLAMGPAAKEAALAGAREEIAALAA